MPVILLKDGDRAKAVLFSFVPKTGGTALVKYLAAQGAHVFLSHENNPMAPTLKCPVQHFHYALLEGMCRFERFAHSFAIVRNPFDRARSDYLWGYRNRPSRPAFDDWLKFVLQEYRKDPFAFDNHIRPQSEFVGPGIRKVYRYEDGHEAIVRDIHAQAGVPFAEPGEGAFVPRENTAEQHSGSALRSADVAMSNASRDLLRAVYRKDFELFYPHLLAD